VTAQPGRSEFHLKDETHVEANPTPIGSGIGTEQQTNLVGTRPICYSESAAMRLAAAPGLF
jgi:hypothetical protein